MPIVARDLCCCAFCTLCTESAKDPQVSLRSMPVTVKARRKYGANSLDLTIPASVCQDLDIQPGDVFEISAQADKGKVRLTYTKVYKYRND